VADPINRYMICAASSVVHFAGVLDETVESGARETNVAPIGRE